MWCGFPCFFRVLFLCFWPDNRPTRAGAGGRLRKKTKAISIYEQGSVQSCQTNQEHRALTPMSLAVIKIHPAPSEAKKRHLTPLQHGKMRNTFFFQKKINTKALFPCSTGAGGGVCGGSRRPPLLLIATSEPAARTALARARPVLRGSPPPHLKTSSSRRAPATRRAPASAALMSAHPRARA